MPSFRRAAATTSAAAAAEPQPAQVRASFLSSTPGIPLPSPPPPSPSTTTACADAPANIAEGCCSDPPDPRDPPGAGLRSLPGPGLGSAPRSGLGPWVRAWIRAGAVPHGVEASLHTSSPSPPYAPLGGAGRVGGAAAAPPMATRPHHAPPLPLSGGARRVGRPDHAAPAAARHRRRGGGRDGHTPAGV